MKPRSLALIVSTIAAVAAPTVAAGAATPAPVPSHLKTYGLKDSGRTVNIGSGGSFKVRLQNCGDCGEWWVISKQPSKRILTLDSRHVTSTAKPPAVGGENHTIWTFTTGKNPGATTMVMSEHSAEKGGKVVKRFTLTVNVETLARD